MRPIPKNRILEDQHTNGTGFGKNLTLRFVDTKKPYIGSYTVLNGVKFYAGKTYDENSKPLERYTLPKKPSLIASLGSIATGASLFKTAGTLIQNTGGNNTVPNPIRYFYKDLTSPDILIKEIDKKAYDKLTNKPSNTYQVISYNKTTQTLEEVNKQMPGLTAFLAT